MLQLENIIFRIVAIQQFRNVECKKYCEISWHKLWWEERKKEKEEEKYRSLKDTPKL
jgi:hypothetical protein